MLSHTPEMRRMKWTSTCPRCKKPIVGAMVKYFHSDGRAISLLAVNQFNAPDAIAQCPRCKGTWAVFQTGAPEPPQPAPAAEPGVYGRHPDAPGQSAWPTEVVAPQSPPGYPTSVPGYPTSAPPFPQAAPGFPQAAPAYGSAAVPRPRQVEVVETERVEEPIGEDRRTIDNSGPATSTRRIKVTKRWLRKYEVSTEETKSIKFGGSIPKILFFELSGEAEKALSRTYSLSGEEEQTFEEELELSVPPRTIVTLVLSWKRVWQHGHVAIVEPDGATHEVPFRVVAGVTFDQAST